MIEDKLTGVTLQLEKFHDFYAIGREAIDEIKKLRQELEAMKVERDRWRGEAYDHGYGYGAPRSEAGMTHCSFSFDSRAEPWLFQSLLTDGQGVVSHHQVPVTEADIRRLYDALHDLINLKYP